MALISQLSVNLNANTKGLEKGFKRAQRKVKNFTNSIFNIKTAVAGVLGIGGIGAMVGDLVAVNSEMQNIKTSLKTVTGSADNAAKAFERIRQFSITTPFELNEVQNAFIKLKAFGLDPSERALTSYGNTASAFGKDLNTMVQAVANATTGEMEMLKQFGIIGRQTADEVAFTFKGVTTTVKKNAAEIEGYLRSIGEIHFGGAMADQMKNLGPAFSNFRTAVQDLKVAIGEAGLNDAITTLVNSTTDWINTLDRSKIEDFTRSTIGSIANMLDSISGIYDYIAGNKFLQWGGLVGFMLFGKLGIGGAILLDKATDKLGKNIGIAWEQLNPSQVSGGSAGMLPRDQRFMQNYQLGDFNNMSAQQDRRNREILGEKYGSKIADNAQEQTNVLNDIADLLRQSQGNTVAVAG